MTLRTFLSGLSAQDNVSQQMPYEEKIERAARAIQDADYILIGAGAGLSTAAGLVYDGKRFEENFPEFIEKYGMTDMYSAGFYPFPSEEARWGYWSKHVYVNRIEPDALPLYKTLYEIVREKPYFVLTTNADHQFYKAGFGEDRIFAIQGDYGYIQCMRGCHDRVYDNTKMVGQMHQARRDCLVPSYMVPRCPVCGGPMTMNLRCDRFFVEDAAWHRAEEAFEKFLQGCKDKKTLLLELGVGFNTPVIIRFPFEKLVRERKNIRMLRLNLEGAEVPDGLGDRALGIDADMAQSIADVARALDDQEEHI